MKTTKDFPATHSMSTSWFVADEDGNIALFDFNENGPIPKMVPNENDSCFMTSEKDLGATDSDSIDYLELTDEQVEELMSDAVSPDKIDIVEHSYDYFVQVDEAKKKEFFEVFRDNIDFCLSHKHGIYFVWNVYDEDEPEFYRNREKETFLKTVKRVVHMLTDGYDTESYGTEGKNKWKLPFYCYQQEYNPNYPAKRVNVPKVPFKENQIPEHQRHKLVRLPLKFSECTEFKIDDYIDDCRGY